MIKYRYTIGNQSIETIDLSSIPKGIRYETINEVVESNFIEVPQEVQLWRIRTILKSMKFEDSIETVLNNLEEPTKTAALCIWNYGTSVERNSQTVALLQTALELTNEQVDEMFIEANNIKL